MAERQRGPAGGLRSGALLDQLVVKIDVDLSGFRRGIAEAIAQIRTLRGAIAGQVGGASLGDAMTAALVAPMVVATARIGQMRNELRLLTTEMRNVAMLTASTAASTAIVPYAAGGPIVNATQRQGRRANGQFGAMAYRVEGDDLADAARGSGMGAGEAAATGAAAGAASGRRRGGFGAWIRGQGARTAGAFESGRANFPGYGAAVENLGGSAYAVGRAGRGAMGSGLARALGLVGLGSLVSSLIQLVGSLATAISGTLAGAFAALATPLGLVVVALTALVALFVASNWDSFKEFGEWFATRWKEVIESEGWGDLVDGVNNLKSAFGELWETIKTAFHDDSNSIGAVLRFFGETVIRIINAVMELLGGLMDAIAELVRMVAALIRGDWADAWGHFSNVVGGAFRTVLDTIGSLFPEIQSTIDNIANWVENRFRTMGEAVSRFWNQLGSGGGGSSVPPGSGRAPNGALDRGTMPKGGFGKLGDNRTSGIPGYGINDNAPMDEALNTSTRYADAFGSALTRALNAGATGGMKFKDVLRQLLADLIQMTAQVALIEPLTRQWGEALSGLFGGGMGGGGTKGKGGSGFWGAIMQGIGSLFGGFFADGGTLKPGQWGIVGERGPEIAFGGKSGMSIHANDNGGARIDARSFIDARGADPAAIARLQAAQERRDRELPSRIRAELGEVRQRRGPGYG